MLPRLDKNPNFIDFVGAAQNCKFCRDYCKRNMILVDTYKRQTKAFLEAIINSDIARRAESLCEQCDYTGAVMKMLRRYNIKV